MTTPKPEEEKKMLRDKTKYMNNADKYSTKKQAFKEGWKAGYAAASAPSSEARSINDILEKEWDKKIFMSDSAALEIKRISKKYSTQFISASSEATPGDDYSPFPLKNVLRILAHGVEILLHKKDYDGPDYEEMEICVRRAKEIINTPTPVKESKEDKSVNFFQTEPDSHYWTSIKMLLNFLNHYMDGTCSVNYLIIGLQNTLKNGYDISAATPSTDSKEDDWKKPFEQWLTSTISFVSLDEKNEISLIIDHVERYIKPASTDSKEVDLLNEIINNQHSLLVTAEHRGYEKAKQEFQATDSREAIEALKELVRLKIIKDELDETIPEDQDQAFTSRYAKYVLDKADAWEKAKEIIKLFSEAGERR